jgi:hypothetical protein
VRWLPATTVYYGLEVALSLPAFTAAWGLWGFGYTFRSVAFEARITDERGPRHGTPPRDPRSRASSDWVLLRV